MRANDTERIELPDTLFAYAMGAARRGMVRPGIALLSNENGEFSALSRPLTRDQIRVAIMSYLDFEDFADSAEVEHLRRRCSDDSEIEEIVAAHELLFSEWQQQRASLDGRVV